jgi:hypothetical protein
VLTVASLFLLAHRLDFVSSSPSSTCLTASSNTYALLRSTGLPFSDKLAPSRFASAPDVVRRLDLVLSQTHFQDKVFFSWTPHGFGSNMINFANYLSYALFNNISVVLVSKGGSPYDPPSEPVTNLSRSILTNIKTNNSMLTAWLIAHQTLQATVQAWFEEAFSYSTVCNVQNFEYKERCLTKPDCDFTPFGPLFRDGEDFHRLVRYFMRDKLRGVAFVQTRIGRASRGRGGQRPAS